MGRLGEHVSDNGAADRVLARAHRAGKRRGGGEDFFEVTPESNQERVKWRFSLPRRERSPPVSVVEHGGAWGLVVGDVLDRFQGAVVVEIGGNAGGPEGLVNSNP